MTTRIAVGKWMETDLVDLLGNSYSIGDNVARAIKSGYAVNIEITHVSRIQDGKMYLGDSKVPVKYPQRLLIVNKIMNEMR